MNNLIYVEYNLYEYNVKSKKIIYLDYFIICDTCLKKIFEKILNFYLHDNTFNYIRMITKITYKEN